MAEMTSRERVERAIRFETPDRLPFNFWLDRRRLDELNRKYGGDVRIVRYGADVVEAPLSLPFPRGRFEEKCGTPWMVEPLFDEWEDVAEHLPMPDPRGHDVTVNVDAALRNCPDKAVIANLPNVLTRIEAMVSQEEFYIALMEAPDDVHSLFDRMSDVMAAAAERVCRMDITALYVQDDVASNKGLLISPAQVREFILPHWKKVIDVAHAHNKPVFFHTDGRIEELYSLFADELKVCMLNPLQPDLQDVGVFSDQYKGRTGIYGGLYTGRIHMMSPGEIREHVLDLFQQAGRGGGLIASSHDLDFSTSEQQLDALTGAIKECVY